MLRSHHSCILELCVVVSVALVLLLVLVVVVVLLWAVLSFGLRFSFVVEVGEDLVPEV